LKNRREEDHSTFDLICSVEREDAEVTWFYEGIEINPSNNTNFDHYQFITEGFDR